MSEHTPESYIRDALEAMDAANQTGDTLLMSEAAQVLADRVRELLAEPNDFEETRPDGSLTEGDRKNFDTLRAAVANEDVALVYTTEKATGRSAALICAMNYVDGEYEAVPLARLVDGDPYELFTDPTEGLTDA